MTRVVALVRADLARIATTRPRVLGLPPRPSALLVRIGAIQRSGSRHAQPVKR